MSPTSRAAARAKHLCYCAIIALLVINSWQLQAVNALLDVRWSTRHKRFHSYSTCDVYTLPDDANATAAHGLVETCGLELLLPAHQQPDELADPLLGQAVGCSGEPAEHGRDFFFIELLRGKLTSVRLPSQHVSRGIYQFLGWPRVSQGQWNATVVLGASAKPRLASLRSQNKTSAMFDLPYYYEMREYLSFRWVQLYSLVLSKSGRSSAVPHPAPLPSSATQPQPALATGALPTASAEPVAGPGGQITETTPGATPRHHARLLAELQRLNQQRRQRLQRRADDRLPLPLPAPAALSAPQCFLPSKGEWVRLPEGTSACLPGACFGAADEALHLDLPLNVARGFRHVYRPWSCAYRMYGAAEARTCLSSRRVLLVGDSRFRQLMESAADLLHTRLVRPGGGANFHLALRNSSRSSSGGSRNSSSSGSSVPSTGRAGGAAGAAGGRSLRQQQHWRQGNSSGGAAGGGLPSPSAVGGITRRRSGGGGGSSSARSSAALDGVVVGGPGEFTFHFLRSRVGLRGLLNRWAWFADALRSFDYVFIGSADHDIADLGRAAEAVQYGFARAPPGAGPHVCVANDSTCAACEPRTAAAAHLLKYRAYAQYVGTLHQFVRAYNGTRAQLAAARAAAARARAAVGGVRGNGTRAPLLASHARSMLQQQVAAAAAAAVTAGVDPLRSNGRASPAPTLNSASRLAAGGGGGTAQAARGATPAAASALRWHRFTSLADARRAAAASGRRHGEWRMRPAGGSGGAQRGNAASVERSVGSSGSAGHGAGGGGPHRGRGQRPAARAPPPGKLAKVYWVFHGNQPWKGADPTFCHPDISDRMLCLHALALQQVQAAGMLPLDLATLQEDAPVTWWDDNVHVGRRSARNGLQAMTLQAFLNALCAQ